MFKELPIIIDPHVHLRVPGGEHKEDWVTGSKAALSGGIGMVFDMPNNNPSIDSVKFLEEKKEIIEKQLSEQSYPLKYKLYFGAAKDNIEEIKKLNKEDIAGIKLFIGSSTGSLLVDRDEDIEKVFKAAQEKDFIVSVHAEDENVIQNNAEKYKGETDISFHSKIRDREAEIRAIGRAINITRKVGNKLYICHLSTKEGLDLVRKAKEEGLKVYCEVCAHHLIFTTEDYAKLGTKIKINPPIRDKEDVEALWNGINDGTIDTLSTDHAPHTLEEKNQDLWSAPSGMPGVELLLPLMLNSVNKGKITLEKLADLMHNNVVKIFELEKIEGKTIIDMDLEKEVKDSDIKSKCGWSPYTGRKLKGWPIKVITNNKEYSCN